MIKQKISTTYAVKRRRNTAISRDVEHQKKQQAEKAIMWHWITLTEIINRIEESGPNESGIYDDKIWNDNKEIGRGMSKEEDEMSSESSNNNNNIRVEDSVTLKNRIDNVDTHLDFAGKEDDDENIEVRKVPRWNKRVRVGMCVGRSS